MNHLRDARHIASNPLSTQVRNDSVNHELHTDETGNALHMHPFSCTSSCLSSNGITPLMYCPNLIYFTIISFSMLELCIVLINHNIFVTHTIFFPNTLKNSSLTRPSTNRTNVLCDEEEYNAEQRNAPNRAPVQHFQMNGNSQSIVNTDNLTV